MALKKYEGKPLRLKKFEGKPLKLNRYEGKPHRLVPVEELYDPIKDGADGRDGLDGKNGRDGRDGKDGRDGNDGAGLNWTGVYKPSQTYSVNDLVEYLGSSYIAVAPSQNKPPNQSRQFWNLFSAAGASGANGPKGDPGPTVGVPTFIQPDKPDYEGSYVWYQTGVGPDGTGHTVWFNNCGELTQ